MDKKIDLIDQLITEDLKSEAEAIAREVENTEIQLSDEVKDDMWMKLQAQIDEYEKERVYEKLTDEDRKALELGRKMLKEEEEASKGKTVYYRKPKKMYVALAAVLVLVMAMGITSIGGAEKILSMMQVMIGNREVVRVDTEENYIVSNENEEGAYQELKHVFGVDPVRIFYHIEGLNYKDCIIDEELQTATLEYEYKGENIHYSISSVYTKSSLGIDIEDIVVNEYSLKNKKGVVIVITEYKTEKKKTTSCSASFEYNGLKYLLVGVMEKENFEILVKNLIFF